ncbi:MAG: cryptochrome/photolyase family protein [Planctomycetota bacterium]|jgi:deoxyribodipyrimidine photolyase-related protein
MHRINPSKALFVVLGNQLFPWDALRAYRKCPFYMAEDVGLCTYVRHHKQKIVLFLAAMRAYRDELRKHDCSVHYEQLDGRRGSGAPASYEEKLQKHLAGKNVEQLVLWEVEDKHFERRLQAFAKSRGLELTFLPSPMFLTPREESAKWLEGNRPHMAAFYRWQRKRMRILIHDDDSPVGGAWSFDAENRLAIPRQQSMPQTEWAKPTDHVRDLIPIVSRQFADHPGDLSEKQWWLPTTRRDALSWLRTFLRYRFDLFGPYEDALSTRDPFLFHSVLSPVMNLGLLTPKEILEKTLEHSNRNEVRLNSLEGFVRQIIGWREFVRGIYQRFSEAQERSNFFGHERSLTKAWFDGTTALLPLDDVIKKALRFGWTHHIERLMVAGNLMTLCEIKPSEAYRWFMELFVDSSDWVMVPNVYGMGIFSDGGIFSTKPYICGSNYIRKMSDYGKAEWDDETNWCDVMDGLYWRFIDRNRAFFRGQARMAQAVGTLDRLKSQRRRKIFADADAFLARVTN